MCPRTQLLHTHAPIAAHLAAIDVTTVSLLTCFRPDRPSEAYEAEKFHLVRDARPCNAEALFACAVQVIRSHSQARRE